MHTTHRYATYRGLLFCIKCGYYSDVRAINLVAECQSVASPATGTGRSNLRRLLAGQLPHSLVLSAGVWPDQRTERLVQLPVAPALAAAYDTQIAASAALLAALSATYAAAFAAEVVSQL